MLTPARGRALTNDKGVRESSPTWLEVTHPLLPGEHPAGSGAVHGP